MAPAQGVLANDTIPNAGQTGITLHAYQVDAPTHGTLTLYEDGSFYYVPAPEFAGADTFRYFIWDSHNDSANIATVTINVMPGALPAGWTATDIAATRSGWSRFDTGASTWTLTASGADIWNASDEFQFAFQNFAGDGAVVARVTSVENTDPWAKAGVMLRDSTSPGAPFAAVFVTPSNGIVFHYRTAAGANATGAAPASGTAPRWVKVARAGNLFLGYYSSDGATWTQIGTSQPITMSTAPRAGLAVTTHDAAQLNTSTFTNVSFTAFTPFQSWQYQNFTTAQLGNANISAPLADANADDVNNLLAYAAGLAPWAAATAANGGRPFATSASGRLAITFARSTANTDLTLTAQGADSPAGPWTDLARSTGGAVFAVITSGATATESGTGTTRTVEVRDPYTTSDPAHPRRFLRVQVLN